MKKDLKINSYSTITIEKGVLTYESMIIPMCNISKISVDTAPKIEYPLWALAGMLVSIVLIFYVVVIGLAGVIICGCMLYSVYIENSNPAKYLVLALNNGERELFKARDKKFLTQAYAAMVDSLKGEKTMVINFDGCVINGNQAFNGDVVMGNNIKNNTGSKINNVKTGDSSSVIIEEKIDYWKELDKRIVEAMSQCEGYPEEYLFCQGVLEHAKKKNAKGIFDMLMKQKPIFKTLITDILSNVAAEGLLEALRNLHIIK